jgi:type III secretion inner rod protein HrpB2
MSLAIAPQLEHTVRRVMDAANPADAVSQSAAERFQTLMAQPTNSAQAPAAGAPAGLEGVSHASGAQHEPNIVSRAVEEQADYYRQVPNDVLYLGQHLSSLSMDRLAAADMTIQLEIASLNADLQVKMATVQSSKDAVQTLMKNQ